MGVTLAEEDRQRRLEKSKMKDRLALLQTLNATFTQNSPPPPRRIQDAIDEIHDWLVVQIR